MYIVTCIRLTLTVTMPALPALMRLNTLFTFMTFSKRPISVAEDVITHGPVKNNYAYVMNSQKKPPGDILACTLRNGAGGAMRVRAKQDSFSLVGRLY